MLVKNPDLHSLGMSRKESQKDKRLRGGSRVLSKEGMKNVRS
jgi:hypothetical protein